MSNSFIMSSSIVKPATMPYGRLKENGLIGFEGENSARALVVQTTDDLSAFASVNLIVDDLDCGAMTVTTSDDTTTLSMTLTSSMIGETGRKVCQLLMVDANNTVIQKSSQFCAYVGRSNDVERSVDDGVTIIILSEAVTEMAQTAAASAAQEAAADIVTECQTYASNASDSADAAASSAASISGVATQVATNTTEIGTLKADLGTYVGALGEFIESAEVTENLSVTIDGATVEYVDSDTIKVYGTATAVRQIGFLNGQSWVKYSASVFDKTLDAGLYVMNVSVSGYCPNFVVRGTYTTFSDFFTIDSNLYNYGEHTVLLTAPAMIGFASESGINYGTSDNPTYITFSAEKIQGKDPVARAYSGYLQSVDTDTADETDKTDMTSAIMEMLNETGYCRLGEGIFYVSGNIDMPEGATLCGCGEKTDIRLLASVSSGYIVKMQAYNTIKDVKFSGAHSAIGASTNNNRNAVHFVADYDGTDTGTAYTTSQCMMDNVWIFDFAGSGIYCHNSSISVSKGLFVSNAHIARCYAGINIDYYSEFNKFTNVCTTACYYGCINNGGNNVFTACTFHAKNTGFYIDGTQPNASHGIITGCTFCHVGSNNGTAIKIDNAQHGFIISNCQIWYCSVDISESIGIVFDGCEFGRGITNDGSVSASITVDGGNLVMFSGCIFHMDETKPPRITITNNTKTVFNGCYGTESGNLISA